MWLISRDGDYGSLSWTEVNTIRWKGGDGGVSVNYIGVGSKWTYTYSPITQSRPGYTLKPFEARDHL